VITPLEHDLREFERSVTESFLSCQCGHCGNRIKKRGFSLDYIPHKVMIKPKGLNYRATIRKENHGDR
jgi:hypothetical protein